jgi:non-specific serine/threonine protein kinase
MLRRIAVFPGPFSLEAAAAVCGDEGIDEWRVLELLASLVDKSLVLSERSGSAQRYRMLDSIRAYAREKSLDEGETESANRRHAQYFASLAQRAASEFSKASSTTAWAGALELELENFRAALDWSLGNSGDMQTGVRLLTSLQEFWLLEGLAPEVLRYAHQAQTALDDIPAELRAPLWLSLARMQHECNSPTALLEAASRACELFEAAGDERGLATALRERGIAQMHVGSFDDSERDLQRSLEMFRRFGDVRMVARTLGSLGGLRQLQGQFEDARSLMVEVLQLSKEIEDERSAIVMSMNIAETDFALGDAERAAERARENLAQDPMLRKSVDLRATQEANLAAYLFALGQDEEARSMALLALRDADYYYAAVPIQHIAAIISPSDPERAARLLGYSGKILGISGFSVERTEQYTRERLMATLREKLDPALLARLLAEGASMPEEQAHKLARRRTKEAR